MNRQTKRRISLRAKMTATLAAAFLLIGIPVAVQAAPTFTFVKAKDAQNRIVIRGGVIRLGTNVYIHDNATHASVGLTKIRLAGGCDLRVYTDRANDEEVVSAIAEEDETISRLGIQAGVTGGVTYATVFLYRNGKHICADDKLFGTNSNIWLQLTYLKDKP